VCTPAISTSTGIPPEARLRNTVLIPVLGDHYGRVLDRGELTIVREGAEFRLAYAEHRYPLNPNSLAQVLGPAGRRSESDQLLFLADAFGALPRPTATDRASLRRRRRDISVLRTQLQRLLEDDAQVCPALDEAVGALNRDHEALHDVLEQPNYRVAWWRSAGRDLGYRRFFDINTLIGLRVEDEQVFADTHQLVLD
jgi:(1->4)-alpha-D-glucan 1-alpha-D-glucosylmutase